MNPEVASPAYEAGYRSKLRERLAELREARDRLWSDRDDPGVLSELTTIIETIHSLEQQLTPGGWLRHRAVNVDHRRLDFFGSPVSLGVTQRWGSAIWMPAQQR